jgi:hypothetical protein
MVFVARGNQPAAFPELGVALLIAGTALRREFAATVLNSPAGMRMIFAPIQNTNAVLHPGLTFLIARLALVRQRFAVPRYRPAWRPFTLRVSARWRSWTVGARLIVAVPCISLVALPQRLFNEFVLGLGGGAAAQTHQKERRS